MLTDLDQRVLAHINLYAVLGALPSLVKVVPEASALLDGVTRPTSVTVRVPGVTPGTYLFTREGVSPADAPTGRRVTLAFTSPEHFNRMVAGTAQPIPVAGPRGLGFLTKVFAPLADVLGRYLQPAKDDLADAEFRDTSTVLTLHVAVAAIAQVANQDRQGQFSAALIPDGQIALEVGDQIDLRLAASDHVLTFAGTAGADPARAALRFADLTVAGDVLSGRASALGSICDGTLGMRGYIPMLDNVSRILDRVGHYLGE